MDKVNPMANLSMKQFLFSMLLFTIIENGISAQTKVESLLVFVGEKISIKELPQQKEIVRLDTVIEKGDTSVSETVRVSMDGRFLVKYKILQKLYGSFSSDTIEFFAFDHFGIKSHPHTTNHCFKGNFLPLFIP